MESGTYYIGDLCYMMRPEWDEVCSLMFAGRDDHGCNQGEFTLADGRRFAVLNTAYGDGVYEDQQERRYPVDAGCIGAIRVRDVSEKELAGLCWLRPNGEVVMAGHLIHFDKPFNVINDDGVLRFGSIVIDTRGE